MTAGDLYTVLGLKSTATQAEIKAAYKRKARHAHPDRSGGSHDDMARLNQAYGLLADPVRRQRYDDTGEVTAPPPIDTQALEMLFQGMNAFLESPREDNPIDVIQENLTRFQSQLQSQHGQAARMQKRLAQQHKKLAGAALFDGLFEQKQAALTATLENLDRQQAVVERALELLKEVSWTGEQPKQISPATFWGTIRGA